MFVFRATRAVLSLSLLTLTCLITLLMYAIGVLALSLVGLVWVTTIIG
jgi:hypothetical protein